jgi:Beta-propeller repeat
MNSIAPALSPFVSKLAAGLTLALALATALAMSDPAGVHLGGDRPGVAPAAAYGELPLAFEPNAGRSSAPIDFVARTSAGVVELDGGDAVVRAGGGAPPIALRLIGARDARPLARDRLPGVVNDLRGADPVSGIRTYERVRYPSVYPGVSLDWYGSGRALEYDFRLAPGADPGRIALRVGHADRVAVGENGGLRIRAGGRTLRQLAPVAYQRVRGRVERIPVRYRVDGRTVAFRLGDYDASKRVVIDPVVLAYSTYLGGNSQDVADAIAVDSTGAAYIAGTTFSNDLNTVGPIEGDSVGGDVFVSKLNPAGNALVYSTYVGGDGSDGAAGIAVDGSGAAYVTGFTESTDFNVVNQYEADPADGSSDAFVARLNPAGSAITYSTYLGGASADAGNAIAVDSSGRAYVTGQVDSADFDTVGGVEGDGVGTDAFVAKLDPAQAGAASLVYSTYLGGDGADTGFGIAVDSSGSAYVTGETTSTDFNLVDAYEGNDTGTDAFLTKLNAAGNGLTYSTYLGGSGFDAAGEIAIDPAGRAYVTGRVDSTDFPLVGQIEGNKAGPDAFVAKLDPGQDGASSLLYSTYLGGASSDFGRGIGVDATGAAYVAIESASTDFNTVEAFETNSAGDDVVVAKLNPAGGALVYSTYIGGAGSESPGGIAVDSTGAAFVAGQTTSTDYDVAGPIETEPGDNDGDAFISKLTFTPPPAPDSDGDGVPDASDGCPATPGPAANGGCPATSVPDTQAPQTTITRGPEGTIRKDKARFSFESSEPGATFECRLDKGKLKPCTSPRKLKNLDDGRHRFAVQATDAAGNTDPTAAKRTFKVDTER